MPLLPRMFWAFVFLGVLSVGLKVAGLVPWPWVWVLSPFIAVAAIGLFILAIVVAVNLTFT